MKWKFKYNKEMKIIYITKKIYETLYTNFETSEVKIAQILISFFNKISILANPGEIFH